MNDDRLERVLTSLMSEVRAVFHAAAEELRAEVLAEVNARRYAYAISQRGEQYLTAEQVAEMFQVKAGTVREWVSKEKIPYRKVGGATRFKPSDLDEWTVPKKS